MSPASAPSPRSILLRPSESILHTSSFHDALIGRWRSTSALRFALVALLATSACSFGRPDNSGATQPIEVDVEEEARTHNGGELYQFIVDSNGFVSAPSQIPAGEVIVTLTYTGDSPAPHSVVFEGLNGDQPVVAVDLPGSNNGSVVLPSGDLVFFDGAPGNRGRGYEGMIEVTGPEMPAAPAEPQATLSWAAEGLEFIAEPDAPGPSDVPITLELTVNDALPHSVAFDDVHRDQPLVAVDGPGTNRRTITLPRGTYVYFCPVPGHREAGMEGVVTIE